jgi:hypothetical protein
MMRWELSMLTGKRVLIAVYYEEWVRAQQKEEEWKNYLCQCPVYGGSAFCYDGEIIECQDNCEKAYKQDEEGNWIEIYSCN